jgi:tetratricopeptide (TPR) repeat protein
VLSDDDPDDDPGSLDLALRSWAAGLPERGRRFSVGRLYLYSGLWDMALEAMKRYYRQVRDRHADLRELGLASYYVAHAYERFKRFQAYEPLEVGDIFMLLLQAEAALDDPVVLARIDHVAARYWGIGEGSEQPAEAWQRYERARARFQEASAYGDLAEVLCDVAEEMPFSRADDPQRALKLAQDALEAAQEVGDLRQMARASSVAGDILMLTMRLDESLAAHERALRWARVLADPAALQAVTWRYGHALLRRGDWAGAQNLLAESAQLAERAELAAHRATVLNALGMAEEQMGNLDAASTHFAQAYIFARLRRRSVAMDNAGLGRARIAYKKGHLEDAKRFALGVLFECEREESPSYSGAITLLREVTGELLRGSHDG